MKEVKVKFKKHIVIGLMLASVALTGCSSKAVPDDQRKLDNPLAVSATDAPAATEAAKPTPSMGSGIASDAPTEVTSAPIDKGKVILVPSATETEVSKNEKITLSVGMLKAGTEYTAKIFYSENGKEDKFIDAGKFKVAADGQLKASIVIPENIASGKYVASLDAGKELYLATIKVA